MEKTELKRIVDVTARAGSMLLRSGAEIMRVENTIGHMMRSFGVPKYDIFTITNGIFLSASDGEEEDSNSYTRICEVPRNSSDLGKVDMINTLSRDIEEGKCTLEGAEARLDEIEKAKGNYNGIISLLAASVASGAFSFLFGGTATDALLAAAVGFSYYYLFILLNKTKLSKLLTNAICGFILALLTVGLVKLIPDVNMDKVIIGAIMPLIPGVSFVNAVRDIAAGDYISGAIRMIDAIVIAAGIAVGVGVTLLLFTRIGVI